MESTINYNTSAVKATGTTPGEESQPTTKDTFMEEVKTYMAFKIATYIAHYWFPILIPIGWFGNTLSFIIMLKHNNRKISTCVYMAAISVNDNIMMYLCLHDFLVGGMEVHG